MKTLYAILITNIVLSFLAILVYKPNSRKVKLLKRAELELINDSDTIMRVFTTESAADMKILRKKSKELALDDVLSEHFITLKEKMIATVTSPEHDGVGIAAPQVGLNRRVIAVQRFDKVDKPFEVYVNVRIIEKRGEKVCRTEACLSVPDIRGDVARYRDITIEYLNLYTLKYVQENIQGYTAVIFQHECDHLDGILFTDKITK